MSWTTLRWQHAFVFIGDLFVVEYLYRLAELSVPKYIAWPQTLDGGIIGADRLIKMSEVHQLEVARPRRSRGSGTGVQRLIVWDRKN